MKKYPTIIGIIEFRERELSYRVIQKRFGVGASTIHSVMSKYTTLGLELKDLLKLDPQEVELLFYPPEGIKRKEAQLPDFQKCYDRIHAKGSRINLTFLWYEYKEANSNGYQLTQFYEYYNRFVKEHYGLQDIEMAVERIPGERLYIDWVGDQPYLLTNSETGEIEKVHIFTTTMGFSSKVFAEIFTDEKIDKFIKGCMDAISYYGGTPKYFVPDNFFF